MELYDISATDFGPYEKFELPLHKQGLVWIGGVNKDTVAADSNGSGKSTIFKAITWGLYGDTIDGERGDKIIREGATKATVRIGLLDRNRERWEVIRQRSKGAPRISLIRPNGEQFPGSKNEIQDRISLMVGLDFKSFKNTVLYGQNDSSRFANPSTKDVERKMMLHRILNTELLTKCHDKAKEIAKEFRTENRTLESKIESLQVAIEEHDVDGLSESHEEYERERKAKVKEHKKLAIAFKDRAKTCFEEADEREGDIELPDVDSIKKAIDEKNIEVMAAEKASEEAEDLLEETRKLEEEYLHLKDILDVRVGNISAIERQLSPLTGDKNDRCPMCTAPLKKGAAHAHIKQLENELKLEQAEKKKEESAAKKAKSVLDKRRTVYIKVGNYAGTLPSLLRELARLNTKLSDAKLEIAGAKNRASELRIAAEGLIAQAKKELSLAKEAANADNPYEEQLEKAKERVDECNEKIAKREKELRKNNNELSYYEFWVKGFSNQGLPSFILDSVMPYITERTNHYLETLSDGDITMEFSTQRELKSAKGEMRDEIYIRWEIEGFEMYPPSGGQLKKMEVATDLALMDLVAANEGGSLDLLMLDEVLDGLDAEGCSRVLFLLQKLRARRGSIFVVSHESRMAEVFEKGLYAVKDGGVTTLEVA